MAILCSSNCAANPVGLGGSGCDITTRTAGIDRLVWARCDIEFTLITDLSEWETKMGDGEIVFSGPVLGQKTKGTFTKKKLASCYPERVTGVTRNIAWKDANADNTDFTDYDFYNDKQANQGKLVFGYLTCEELFYGFFSRWSIEVDDVRVENSDEEFNWDGVVQYLDLTAKKPVSLTGISALIGAES